jgi:F-type H+-transporting ATPase subunit a
VATSSFAADSSGEFNIGDMIKHHVLDSHEWHFWDGATLYLPVILYSAENGLDIFSSSNFYDEGHNVVPYGDYIYEHGHIISQSGAHLYDFSITKNVAALFIVLALMLWVFIGVARKYKRNPDSAPTGLQNFLEIIIEFIRDDVVKPNIGPKYRKFLPYMLTLFFFVFFGNLVGLIPGSANMSGNIAVTLVLGLLTFVMTLFNGNKNYWGHIFKPPGVPMALLPIMIPIEIIGIFTKPFSLILRLFAAITAGHMVVLGLIGITFIFASWGVGIGTALVVGVINLIEILVATIQAFVFTLFSSMYIGMAVAEHDHH